MPHFLKIIAVLLPACLLMTCLNLARETPTKRSFHLDVRHPGRSIKGNANKVLKIQRLGIEPVYGGRNLVYRLSDVEYESDYYSEFLISPATEIQSLTRDWLDRSGIFSKVTGLSSQLTTDYILEGHIQALYGDFHQEPYRAVLEIQFVMLHSNDGSIAFSERYHRSITINERNAALLVKGWSTGLQEILSALEQDLQTLKSPAPAKKDS